MLCKVGGGFGISSYMQYLGCYMGQKEVFEEASQSIGRLTGAELSAKQVERLCHYYGTLLESELEASILAGETGDTFAGKEEEPHYLMADGAMFMTREDSWKEAKLARIFRAGDCLKLGEVDARGWIRESQYVVHLGGYKEFLEKLEYRIHSLKRLVIVADGAPWFWDWVESCYPGMVQILDFYHATQHLWAFAREWFKDELERKHWAEARIGLLLEDGIDEVLQELQSIEESSSKAAEKARRSLIQYYKTHQKRMKYKTYRDQGLLIGSGPIESAHRDVLQERLKLSGQRWTFAGWQAVANLRALEKGSQWHRMIAFTQDKMAA